MTITYCASTTFEVVNAGLTAMCMTSMGFLAVKNLLPSFYNPSTSSAVVKAALLNLYRPLTDLAMVKMYLLNIYKPSTDSVL